MGIFDKVEKDAEEMAPNDPKLAQQASQLGDSQLGRDMQTAHRGMNITDAQFNALVEDLVKSLDKFKVPAQEKGELLGILGPMKPSIVGQ